MKLGLQTTKFGVLLLALLAVTTSSVASEEQVEVQHLYKELELKIQAVLKQVAAIEKARGNPVRDIEYNLVKSRNTPPELGLILEFNAGSGLRVLASSPNSRVDNLNPGDVIVAINQQSITPDNAQSKMTWLHRHFGYQEIDLLVRSGAGKQREEILPAIAQIDFVLRIGSQQQ